LSRVALPCRGRFVCFSAEQFSFDVCTCVSPAPKTVASRNAPVRQPDVHASRSLLRFRRPRRSPYGVELVAEGVPEDHPVHCRAPPSMVAGRAPRPESRQSSRRRGRSASPVRPGSRWRGRRREGDGERVPAPEALVSTTWSR
jgi:hypothetical protein